MCERFSNRAGKLVDDECSGKGDGAGETGELPHGCEPNPLVEERLDGVVEIRADVAEGD